MLTIGRPFISRIGEKSRLNCDILVEEEKRTLWIEVDKEYEKYLCTERCDAYVVGLLGWCVREGHDIRSETPITNELHYNLSRVLIPGLTKYSPELYAVKISAPLESPLNEGYAVGAACSCGIDSFYSIFSHINSPYEDMNLTHLCFHNVGAYKSFKKYGIEKGRKERLAKAREVAAELDLPLVVVDSNLNNTFIERHLFTHTFENMFVIYAMQMLWKIYYYSSSGLDFSNFTVIDINNKAASHYDLLSLQCLSTKYLHIYSDGGAFDRFEKILAISDNPIVQKYLHVCVYKPYNCNICDKCRRTLLMLDEGGILDQYYNVFDINYYRNHIDEYYRWLYNVQMKGGLEKELTMPVYTRLQNNKAFISVSRKEHIKRIIKRPLRPVYRLIKKCVRQ